ncbi:hypothetical protein GOV07_05015 [Candidatus Woesearchaeota archaeon]|nr:hypothetical protein [Candidatus Woesearchaeota archaeon]
MKQTIARKVKATIAGLGMLLSTVPALAGDGWATIQPSYNAKSEAATVRVEGGTQLPLDLSLYGFADVDATTENPLDLESFYSEVRLTKALGKGFGVAAEYNGGTGMKGTVRAGVTYMPKLGKGSFTLLKAFPVDTAGYGAQLDLYSEQQMGKGWSGSVLADYNVDPGTVYAELKIKKELSSLVSVYGQARCFGTPSKMDCAPVAGLEVKLR